MSQIRQALLGCQVDPISWNEDVVCQRYCLPEDFVGFAGHFPNYPIVPAVVQILMAQLVAEQHLDSSLQLGSVDRCKFQRQLKPLDLIDVYCQRKQVRSKMVIDCKLKIAGELVAGFWLVVNREKQS